MKLSPYFSDLRLAYEAELDDLATDSEGNDVLRKRLAQKRKEIGFLVQMMDLSPEMVAVVFHQGFRFIGPAAMEQLLGQHRDELPDWNGLTHVAMLEPWAVGLAQTVLREPQGARFMAVAAVLEYLHQNAHTEQMSDRSEENADAQDPEEQEEDGLGSLSADDASEPRNSQDLQEAQDDWLAEVGFDRKP